MIAGGLPSCTWRLSWAILPLTIGFFMSVQIKPIKIWRNSPGRFMANTRLLSTRQDTVRFNLGVPLKALQKRPLQEETCVATLVNAILAPRMGVSTVWKWSESVVTQSHPTLQSHGLPPASSVHEILQARILEWVAISFSGGSSLPRDQTQVSSIAGRCYLLVTLGSVASHSLPPATQSQGYKQDILIAILHPDNHSVSHFQYSIQPVTWDIQYLIIK